MTVGAAEPRTVHYQDLLAQPYVLPSLEGPTALQLWACDGSATQRWVIVADGTIRELGSAVHTQRRCRHR
jgi:hypothetical protein